MASVFLQRLLDGGEALASAVSGESLRARVGEVAPRRLADEDDAREVGALAAHLLDHARVVARLELRGGDQCRDAGLAQHVLEFVAAVGGVDVDEDGADLGRRVLGERPLGAVGRPDADAVARRDVGVEQGQGKCVDVVEELRVRPATAAHHVDERLTIGMCSDGRVEVVADRLLDQRRFGRPTRVAERRVEVVLEGVGGGHRLSSGRVIRDSHHRILVNHITPSRLMVLN